MMFCPKCGSMLRPKLYRDKKVMACSCGYIENKDSKLILSEKKKEDIKLDVIEQETSAYPITDAECPKCKNNKAYSWSQQMRAGDEPETHFFKCTKCEHTWRDGD
ncbi:MAG: transcription factor S [Candidatus Woesearchaeota archaeon]|nr:MAG: transcription factor S [Candidatus Woesearchaeota archaeon]